MLFLTHIYACFVNGKFFYYPESSSIWQQWKESLHLMIETIYAEGEFKQLQFARLWVGSSKATLANALLKTMRRCVEDIQKDENRADAAWSYLTGQILPLQSSVEDDAETHLIWDSPVPRNAKWAALLVDVVQKRLEERRETLGTRSPPIKQGWLQKRGNLRNKGWRKRYFVAMEHQAGVVVVYFQTQEDAENLLQNRVDQSTRPKGGFNLSQVQKRSYNASDLTMELECADRSWSLKVGTEEDYADWVDLFDGGHDLTPERYSAVLPSAADMLDTTDEAAFRSAVTSIFGALATETTIASIFKAVLESEASASELAAAPKSNLRKQKQLSVFAIDQIYRQEESETLPVSNSNLNPIQDYLASSRARATSSSRARASSRAGASPRARFATFLGYGAPSLPVGDGEDYGEGQNELEGDREIPTQL